MAKAGFLGGLCQELVPELGRPRLAVAARRPRLPGHVRTLAAEQEWCRRRSGEPAVQGADEGLVGVTLRPAKAVVEVGDQQRAVVRGRFLAQGQQGAEETDAVRPARDG